MDGSFSKVLKTQAGRRAFKPKTNDEILYLRYFHVGKKVFHLATRVNYVILLNAIHCNWNIFH